MHRPGPDTVEADTPLLKQGLSSAAKKDARYGTERNSQQRPKDAFPIGTWVITISARTVADYAQRVGHGRSHIPNPNTFPKLLPIVVTKPYIRRIQ